MSEQQRATASTETHPEKRDAKEESTRERPIIRSPERASTSGEDDDITPCYVRGYN